MFEVSEVEVSPTWKEVTYSNSTFASHKTMFNGVVHSIRDSNNHNRVSMSFEKDGSLIYFQIVTARLHSLKDLQEVKEALETAEYIWKETNRERIS